MGENSAISWTDHTFNPWWGCQKVGPGCDNCYAEALDARFHKGAHWGPKAPRRRTSQSNWQQPTRWNKAAEADGTRPKVFCASMADVFDNAIPQEWRTDLWALIRSTPNLVWILVTKRIGNAQQMLPEDWGDGWPNVWLLATVCNQEEADRDIETLLCTPAAVHGLSIEPLLGHVTLTCLNHGVHDTFEACGGHPDPYYPIESVGVGYIDGLKGEYWAGTQLPDGRIASESWEIGYRVPKIDWVITGWESGPNARTPEEDWVRSLQTQCAMNGTAFFYKQAISDDGQKIETPELNGKKWMEFPSSPGRPVARKPKYSITVEYESRASFSHAETVKEALNVVSEAAHRGTVKSVEISEKPATLREDSDATDS